MVIQLPADVEANIRELLATGRFANEGDVIRAAIRLLDKREQRITEFRASIQEGIAAIERGEGIELTDQLWDDLEREAEEMAARGEQPDPDVCP